MLVNALITVLYATPMYYFIEFSLQYNSWANNNKLCAYYVQENLQTLQNVMLTLDYNQEDIKILSKLLMDRNYLKRNGISSLIEFGFGEFLFNDYQMLIFIITYSNEIIIKSNLSLQDQKPFLVLGQEAYKSALNYCKSEHFYQNTQLFCWDDYYYKKKLLREFSSSFKIEQRGGAKFLKTQELIWKHQREVQRINAFIVHENEHKLLFAGGIGAVFLLTTSAVYIFGYVLTSVGDKIFS